jgi:cobalt/nickel transport system permease protein
MHIPDMILSGRVAAVTGVVAAAGLGLALVKVRRHLGERVSVLTGVVAAFVFVAQMVNFPVGPGVSGHLMGGVLAAVLVGPWAGAVAIAAVLIVQCLLFGDGGLTALGANFLNLGLIGAVLGYAIYAPLRRAIGGRKGTLIAAMLASWLVVMIAAAMVSVQLAASTTMSSFPRIFIWMMLVHAVIGVGEALITGLVLRFVLLVRPDFVFEPETAGATPLRRLAGTVAAGLGIALAVAVVLAPLAWTTPDGLEFVGARLGIEPRETTPVVAAPMPDYELPGVAGRFGLGAATAAAGVVGTLIVFIASLMLARVLQPSGAGPSHDVLLTEPEPEPEPEPAHVG